MGGRMNIAVCEGQAEERERLVQAVNLSLADVSVRIAVSEFPSGEALLAEFVPGMFDVLFLDVYMHMGGMNGMQVARVVREMDQHVPIVFVTASQEFALESYQVRAMHYLMKPVQMKDLLEVWNRLPKSGESGARMTLMVDRKPVDIRLSQVIYVEASNKRCALHTVNGIVVTRLSIDQLQYMLPDPPFSRCHRGYIVNFEYVRSVDEDFQMQNGDTVYIRQNDRARIREMYLKNFMRKVREK